LSRLGELLSPERDLLQWQLNNFERILAQAKLVRLEERISRSSDPSSPRRDLAQW